MTHFYLRHSSFEETKLIISVSKKVEKSAVARNKIKRRVRSVFRNLKPSLKSGIYLIIAKSGAGNVKGKELENELKSAMIV